MKTPIHPEDWPAHNRPTTPGIVHNGLIYASGQVGTDLRTGKLAEGAGAQTTQALANLAEILEAAGGGLDTILKATVYLTDMAHFADMNAAYRAAIPAPFPARSTVTAGLARPELLVEIEAIAAIRPSNTQRNR